MKFSLNIRHRPLVSEDIDERFAHFERTVRALPSPWCVPSDRRLLLSPLGTASCRTAQLGRKLGPGMKGFVSYMMRVEGDMEDHGSDDDMLIVDFDAQRVNWAQLVNEAFPGYVHAMGAYIGGLWREDTMGGDWKKQCIIEKSTGKNLDGRDGFYRFGPINYLDRELCRRSCDGLTPEHIVQQLRGAVPEVKLFEDGVLIVAAEHFPEAPEIAAKDRMIRARLGIPVWAKD